MKTNTLQTYHSRLQSGLHPLRLDTEAYFPDHYCEPVLRVACDPHYGDAVWRDKRVTKTCVKEHIPKLGEVPPDPLFGGKMETWAMYDWLDQMREAKKRP